MTAIKILPVFRPVAQAILSFPYKVLARRIDLPGGRQGGKTYQVLALCISVCVNVPKMKLRVLRRTDKDVKEQKIKEIRDILDTLGLREHYDFEYNKGERIFKLNNGSEIKLDSLNDEIFNPEEGAKLNLANEPSGTPGIINFFEECTQLHPKLVDQYEISSRVNGDLNRMTPVMNIFVANPYGIANWFNERHETFLPPNPKELDEKGWQFKYDPETKYMVLRTNYKINKYASDEFVQKLKEIKQKDYEQYKVVGLGMSGAVEGAIYQKSMSKRKKYDGHVCGRMIGGYDFGWSVSDTYGCVGCIDLAAKKVKVIDEFRNDNKKNPLTTDEQVDMAIAFYKRIFMKYGKPITIFVDNASLSDFYNIFNNRLEKFGLTRSQLEFFPAPKQQCEEQRRVEITKFLLSMGYLEIADKCESLIKDLLNCYWIIPKTIHEGQVYERSHEYTHGINGFEYMWISWAWEIINWNPYYFTNR